MELITRRTPAIQSSLMRSALRRVPHSTRTFADVSEVPKKATDLRRLPWGKRIVVPSAMKTEVCPPALLMVRRSEATCGLLLDETDDDAGGAGGRQADGAAVCDRAG